MNLGFFARRSIIALAASCATLLAAADNRALPNIYNQGFSAPRLDTLSARINKDVGDARLPGAVILVARNGNLVHAETIGL